MLVREKRVLEKATQDLDRVIEFINSDKTSVMRAFDLHSSDVFTSSYYPNEKWFKINKEAGSELAFLRSIKNALDSLK